MKRETVVLLAADVVYVGIAAMLRGARAYRNVSRALSPRPSVTRKDS